MRWRRLASAALTLAVAARVAGADDSIRRSPSEFAVRSDPTGSGPAEGTPAAGPNAEEIYRDACAACHGIDGRGAPAGTRIDVPLPDFSDCNFITREGDGNWRYLLAHGGEGLGLSSQMPAFGDVLTDAQLQATLDYIRSFCHDPRWPRGELNFRRLLITDKAYPEDEAVLVQEFNKGRNGVRDWSTELSVEHRIGARGQVEFAAPLAVHDVTHGATTAGIGDVTLAYKQVVYADQPTMTIASVGLDLVLPTGDRDRGLGDGTVSIEPSLLAGKEIAPIVIQGQILGIAPVDEQRADRGVSYRLALSYPLSPLKSAWVPSVEVEALQNVTARQHNLFVTPQVYKGLSKRGHLALAVGAQIPVAGDTDPFDYRLLAFFLWDYADGGLWW
jgi:mono/diheme cytochrome c family protein